MRDEPFWSATGKNAGLASANQQLEIIFRSLSHDLATPLQTVTVISQIAQEGRFGQAHAKRLQRASDQTNRILRSLVMMSQLTSKRSKLVLERCLLSAALLEAVAFMEPIATKKNIRLLLNASPEEVFVMIERDVFIFQIITNFLTNAVKFSHENTAVIVSFQVLNVSAGNESRTRIVKIVIADQGFGIEAKRMSSLFSWETETSTDGTLGEKGTGFGLPIAKQFLSAMNGEVDVVSRSQNLHPENHGSEIHIFLPVASN